MRNIQGINRRENCTFRQNLLTYILGCAKIYEEGDYVKIVAFDKLYHTDYNLRSIFAMEQPWKNGEVFKHAAPRPTSAFLYLKNCSAVYEYSDKSLEAKRGDVVYIPKGSVYSTYFTKESKESTSAYLIEFNAIDLLGEDFIFADEITVIENIKGSEADCFYDTTKFFKTANPCIAEAKAAIYKLVSGFSYQRKITDIYKSEFSSIAEGIVYMENDIFQEKSIAEIAEMCHVSQSHFRSLFKKYSGVSPISYQINAKIERAKYLFTHEHMTVGEVSEYMGFSDDAYFCKLFKKYTGLSPKAYLGKKRD